MNSALIVMWHRQIKSYFRNRQRLAVTLVQPLLFLIAFRFGIGGMYEQSGRGNYIQFLIPGIVGMTILMSSTMSGMALIWDKQFGFLKETLVAPVSRTSLLFGRCLGGATTSFIQGLIVLLLGFSMGFRVINWGLFPLAFIVMFTIALLFNLLGTSIAAKFDDMHSFPTIMNFMVMPMIFISGALFPTDGFPAAIKFLVKINPFTYCNHLLKYSMGSAASHSILLDIAVIAIIVSILGSLGTYFFNKMET
ncbi:MAG: ABC transporter permease [Methanofastidiosum sp.]|jgi:ABC-2 type transport system permease protein|nr:ABC transporter permease [Methanofastidiosum sp.]